MNEEIIKMIIELIKQGGITAVWTIVLINVFTLLKISIGCLTAIIVIRNIVSGVIKSYYYDGCKTIKEMDALMSKKKDVDSKK